MSAAQPIAHIRYIGAVDTGVSEQPGILIAVTRDGVVHQLPHAVGADCIVRPMPDAGFLILDRAHQSLVRLDRFGRLRSTVALPAGNEPRDAVPLDATTAWVTRRFTNTIESVDLATGAVTPGPDLSPLLVSETTADPEMMLAHDGRVFVQLQRLDDALPFITLGPGAVAVFDQFTGEAVDTDPAVIGVQPIGLLGPAPHLRMHLTGDGSDLLVGATGPRLDPNHIDGGIERVDLSTLTSEGFIEQEVAGNIGAFVPTGSGIGAVSFHTSIIEASHVTSFDIQPGNAPLTLIFEELFVTIETMAYDQHTDSVLMPGANGGMNEFDPATGARNRTQLFDTVTGGFVRDLALAEHGRAPRSLRIGSEARAASRQRR